MTSTIVVKENRFCAINPGSIIALTNKKTLIVGLDYENQKCIKYLISTIRWAFHRT
jgi:hypothetical protein